MGAPAHIWREDVSHTRGPQDYGETGWWAGVPHGGRGK